MTEMAGTGHIDIGRTVSTALDFPRDAVVAFPQAAGPSVLIDTSPPVFLFALGSSCLVISKTDLASWKSCAGGPSAWLSAVSPSPAPPWLSHKSTIVGAAAFTSAILITQWLSLFTMRLYEFSLSTPRVRGSHRRGGAPLLRPWMGLSEPWSGFPSLRPPPSPHTETPLREGDGGQEYQVLSLP